MLSPRLLEVLRRYCRAVHPKLYLFPSWRQEQHICPVYEILFRTTSQTLLTIAADPKRLGVILGFFCVLHTWGQNLHFHPHLHGVVPGGGLSADHQRWITGRRKFLLPVKVLSGLFRRLFLEASQQAYAAGKLQFFGDLQSLRQPPAFRQYLAPLHQQKWVVYAKAPFGGPQHPGLLRLEGLPRCRKDKVMTVSAADFIRRFLQHTLPSGFQRIRYYGFLANCHHARQTALCRQLLAPSYSALLPSWTACRDLLQALTRRDLRRCPQCGVGILACIPFLPPLRLDSP